MQVLVYLGYSIELVGGILLIIGLGSRVVSAIIAVLMIGATLKVKLAIGFLGNGQMAGYELDLALLAMTVFIFMNGSKMFSIDQVVFKQKESVTQNI